MIIGLTGKSCSGKDTVVECLDKNQFSVIDVDKLGHLALEENKEKLVSTFGKKILKDGAIDRKALGEIVFRDPGELKRLEEITHPFMREETIKRAHLIESEGKIAVINCALLERMKLVSVSDEIWLVLSPYEKRLERALKRDGVTEKMFSERTKSQLDIGQSIYDGKKRVFTILNNQGKEELCRQIKFYCGKIGTRGSL